MYDWANSAFVTVVIAAVFPPYFVGVLGRNLTEARATEWFGYGSAIALLVAAIASPFLGVLCDLRPIKKRVLWWGAWAGALATAALGLVSPGQFGLGLLLFGLANIAVNISYVSYDGLLPHVASDDEVDRVSTAGYALGYVGGGLLLVACSLVITNPGRVGLGGSADAVRLSFVVTAVWWIVFSIPLMRRVPEPAIRNAGAFSFGHVVRDLSATLRHLRTYKDASLLLLAFLIYNDGIGTVFRMATLYGKSLNLPTGDMILALIIVQFVGIPATFAFGGLASRVGARRAIWGGLAVYLCVTVLGYFMTSKQDFFILAGLVGLVQGGVQALSRSLFASMIPKQHAGEFFGLFAVFEKLAGILGPLTFAVMVTLTGSTRPAILALAAFFVVGGVLLGFVNVERGRQAARQ